MIAQQLSLARDYSLLSYDSLPQMIKETTHILHIMTYYFGPILVNKPNLVTDCRVNTFLHPICHHSECYTC